MEAVSLQEEDSLLNFSLSMMVGITQYLPHVSKIPYKLQLNLKILIVLKLVVEQRLET